MIKAQLRIGFAPAAVLAVIEKPSADVILQTATAKRRERHHGLVATARQGKLGLQKRWKGLLWPGAQPMVPLIGGVLQGSKEGLFQGPPATHAGQGSQPIGLGVEHRLPLALHGVRIGFELLQDRREYPLGLGPKAALGAA